MVDRSDALEDCFAKTPFLEQNLPGGESVPHGYRFVVSRSGVFISHPHGDYDFARASTMRRDSRTSQGARAATPHSQLLRQDGTASRSALDPTTGKRSAFLFAPVPSADWKFVAVVECDESAATCR